MKKIAKKILAITLITSLLVISMFIINYSDTNKDILKSNNIKVTNDKMIAIMISNEDGTGYYESSSDTFPIDMHLNTTLSNCENGGTISYDGEVVTVEVNRSDKCYVFFDNGPLNFAKYIKNLYSEDGANSLYYHDGVGTWGAYEAEDASYRYAGASANVNNYVCYGSDASTCPSDNLYRVIGIFKDTNNEYQVKLIKATAATNAMLGTNGDYYSGNTYYWNYSSGTSSTNTWSLSRLNTVNLNGSYVGYLNGINAKWTDYIDNHTWIVGGNTQSLIIETAGAKNVFTKEITTPAENTTYQAAIGLMYVSDYMYGAGPSFWANYKGYDSSENDIRAGAGSNWLALGTYEWTITRKSDSTVSAFSVASSGYVYYNNVRSNVYVARPVFYLKSGIRYAGGTGTSGDPYRISS